MKTHRARSLADDIVAFVAFKRALGYGYKRGEFTLRSFGRFVATHWHAAATPPRRDVVRAWMARKTGQQRLPITLAAEYVVIRQFCLFLQRRDPNAFVPPRARARASAASAKSKFLPYIFSKDDIRQILRLAGSLGRPAFRGVLYRTLVLVLYCTGLRFGEALRLRVSDVDVQGQVLFIAKSKGRARWVPFHHSLAPELRRYLRARRVYARASPDDRFFVGLNRERLPINTASDAVRALLRAAGLKTPRGRTGPRPYDFRHAFAVHRLERWYGAGVDVHARLPWLSAYMGHDNILGTEKYLHATPQLLQLAARRLRRRFSRRRVS